MQTVLVVVQRHQQHVSMRAVSSLDASLEETGGYHGLVDEFDTGRRRAERPANFDPHLARLENDCFQQVVRTLLRESRAGDVLLLRGSAVQR
jgi:hypothetical protein